MKAYLQSTACISPQSTWDQVLSTPREFKAGELIRCIEPDYSEWIDARQLRRMSRIMKMGCTAGLLALRKADIQIPDGIISGTGFGCLEDTETFLGKIIKDQEGTLNPTPFIQSTHNTIGSYLAFLIQCRGYNQTYTHDGLSFESALMDAMMQLAEQPSKKMLVMGTDENTETSQVILKRMGLFKNKDNMYGESATAFVVSGQAGKACAQITGIDMRSNQVPGSLPDWITSFLKGHHTSPNEIDLILFGNSGDDSEDALIAKSFIGLSLSGSIENYKHLCGEHPVASAFALWLAEDILRSEKLPDYFSKGERSRKARTILIFNQYFRVQQSLILLSTT